MHLAGDHSIVNASLAEPVLRFLSNVASFWVISRDLGHGVVSRPIRDAVKELTMTSVVTARCPDDSVKADLRQTGALV
jgi:hypothetical protein